MTDQQPSSALAAAFPSPPLFYQHFTPENLDRIATLRAAQQSGQANTSPDTHTTSGEAPTSNPALRLLDLPPELRFLQPPEPPSDGVYRSFGDKFDVSKLSKLSSLNIFEAILTLVSAQLNEGLPSLTSQGISQLYTPPTTPSPSGSASGPSSHSDRALILKRLAKSLLLNFLELMGIMSINPEQYAEKIQDLRTLFINFHHLLNEYRPHQARESLILMMEEQLERARSETNGIEAMKAKVEGILSGLAQAKLAGGEEEGAGEKGYEGDGRAEVGDVEMAIWEELRREFG
jgi:mediator of RNA polymerase II transcription subunit 7